MHLISLLFPRAFQNRVKQEAWRATQTRLFKTLKSWLSNCAAFAATARDLNLNLSMGFPAHCRHSKCTLTHKRYCKHRSKHRFCYMARTGTTEHLNMLFFGKKCVWRCFPVLFAWVHYFRCWSWPKRRTFMRFHMETCRLNCKSAI